MTVRIKPKRGSGAPTTGDLENNEIAIDQSTGILYVRDGGTNIVEVGKDLVHDTSPQLGGNLELDNNFIQNDGNDVLEVDSGALKLYHDGDLQITTGQYETTFEVDVVATGYFCNTNGYDSRILRQSPAYDEPSLTVGSEGADVTDVNIDFALFDGGFSSGDRTFTPMRIGTYHGGDDNNQGFIYLAHRFLGDDVDAPDIVDGTEYEIISTGTTDFTDLGADDSNPGTRFEANRDGDAGDGTGVVAPVETDHNTAISLKNDAGDIITTLKGATTVQGVLTASADEFSQLFVQRESGNDSDASVIEFTHYDPDTEDTTYVSLLRSQKEATNERKTALRHIRDNGDGANTNVYEVTSNLEDDTHTHELVGNVTIDNSSSTNQDTNLTNKVYIDAETTHDMVNNLMDFKDDSPTNSTAYKQNFNFRVDGDNVPANYQFGRIEAGYVHNEPLQHYVRLNTEDEQLEGQNFLEVNVAQVRTNAPVQFANIDSGSSDPGSPNQGDYFFNTTSKQLKLYTGDTPAWTDIGENGQQFYDATADRMLMRIGGAWHSVDTTAI